MARKKSAAKLAKEKAAKQAAASGATTKDNIQTQLANKKQQKQQKPEHNVAIGNNENNEESASESESDSSSSSEEEDEYGELLDPETDDKINQVLQALKSNDKALLDKQTRFFEDPEEAIKKLERQRADKTKPMYLKDYHRMNLLQGGPDFEEEDGSTYGEDNGEKIKTYAEAQTDDRNQLLSEIKNAFGDEGGEDNGGSDSEDDDGFLKKKDPKPRARTAAEQTQLPDPEKDQEKFLAEFLNQHAWIPKNKEEARSQLDLGASEKDEIRAEQEFDDAVENFEKVYNFRYEDATASEIISYARNQATMRRAKMNSRKKQRLKKQEKKKEEKKKHEEKVNKKKQDKVNKVMDRLAEVKKAVGDDVDDELIIKVFGDTLMNKDFDDAEWDSKMSEIFNEQYYAAEEKPEWDDDDEIMKEFYDSKKQAEEGGDEEDEEGEEVEASELDGKDQNSNVLDVAEVQEEEQEIDGPPKKKSKKEKLAEKKAAKKSKDSLKKQAEAIVQKNIVRVEEEVDEEEEQNGTKPGEFKFKYREVEPETFGLTQREILFADDKALNEFISLKKLAPYRPPEVVQKDKRKVSKARRVREWRKTVFGSEKGLADE